MTDFWTSPPDTLVRGSGIYTVTVVLPPIESPAWPANDPARAREFAAALDTVDEVLEYEGEQRVAGGFGLQTRADLEWIQVGVWGNVIGVCDPALADNGNSWPVLEQVTELAKRLPGAKIIGNASVDRGESHEEVAWVVPGFEPVHSEGWAINEDPALWTLTGDPQAVLDGCGLAEPYSGIPYDAEDPTATYWGGLSELILGEHDPWSRRLRASAFRVRHTEDATDRMEEGWLQGVP
ncbi:DUF6333 family protein [Phytomonospora sp. NPDC050363]|uniref:DUF6333 family protein n=1 Tax=Phytomonospora sp. NPDC050363 TaxID=3155642 RepID=UPI0033C69B4E